jgi:hypothetical protein
MSNVTAAAIADDALQILRRQGLDCVGGSYYDVSEKIRAAIIHAAKVRLVPGLEPGCTSQGIEPRLADVAAASQAHEPDTSYRHTLDCDMVKHPNCTRCSCSALETPSALPCVRREGCKDRARCAAEEHCTGLETGVCCDRSLETGGQRHTSTCGRGPV